MALEKIFYLVGLIGLLSLCCLYLLLPNPIEYEIVVLGLSFLSPFIITLAISIKKGVSLCQSSPWSLFLILSSIAFTSPLLSLLYKDEFLSLQLLVLLATLLLPGWYYLLNKNAVNGFLSLGKKNLLTYFGAVAFVVFPAIAFGGKFI